MLRPIALFISLQHAGPSGSDDDEGGCRQLPGASALELLGLALLLFRRRRRLNR